MPGGLAADHGVFDASAAIASVSGQHLIVPGVVLEPITRTEKAPSEETWFDGSMLAFFKDIVSRHRSRESKEASHDDIPPLQKILRTLRLDCTAAVDESYVFYAFHLLEFLMGADPDHADAHLEFLGIEPPGSDDSAGTAFDRSFIHAFFPGYSGPSHAWGRAFRKQQFQERSESSALIFDLTLLRKRWRFFQTAEGRRFGLGPLNARPGDFLCILHGSAFPVVLRKQSPSVYMHVGVCFVSGLMRGEATEMVASGSRGVETIRLI
jgi:hypothetical protein